MSAEVAYLSMWRLVLLRDGKRFVVQSQFVQEAMERELDRQQRNEWKREGLSGTQMGWVVQP